MCSTPQKTSILVGQKLNLTVNNKEVKSMIGKVCIRRTRPYTKVDTDGKNQGRIPQNGSLLSSDRKTECNV